MVEAPHQKVQMPTLDLAEIGGLRGKGFSAVRCLADRITLISVALEEVDTALRATISNRSSDSQKSLLSAARRLESLVESDGVR